MIGSGARIEYHLAYRLELDHDNKLTWCATIDGEEVVENSEPQSSGWLESKRLQTTKRASEWTWCSVGVSDRKKGVHD